MANDFFARLVAETPTRVWVNNPTPDELELALAHGAVGSTTNPAYGAPSSSARPSSSAASSRTRRATGPTTSVRQRWSSIVSSHASPDGSGSCTSARRDATGTRACHAIGRERGYPATLLCGGSRVPFDLLGLIGAELHVTINWSTFAEVLDAGVPFEAGIDRPIPPSVLDRLARTFPDVRRALDPDGLVPEDFEDFGPVRHFHDAFVVGWRAVTAGIAEARTQVAPPGRLA